jgi:hypothetical protein
MVKNATSLIEEFEAVLSTYSEDVEIDEESLPWASGAVAVKKALDRKHGSRNRASSVIARMGGIKDPQKRKIRDQVLSLYRQEGASIKQMEKDRRAKKKQSSSMSVKKGKVSQEKDSSPEVEQKTSSGKRQFIKPKTPKPHLERILKRNKPRLSPEDKKEVIETAKKVMPKVRERAKSFSVKHPILIKSLKSAAIGGVVGVATAAAVAASGGAAAAAILPAIMANGATIAATTVGSGVKTGLTEYVTNHVNKR